MHFQEPRLRRSKLTAICAAVALSALFALPTTYAAAKIDDGFTQPSEGGGKGGKGDDKDSVKSSGEQSDKRVGKAKLDKNGEAIAPKGAPKEVVKAIKAANKISDAPYQYGGGHSDKKSKGFDCSGAISYALIAAKLLKTPDDSGGFMSYGKKGKGEWISVFANNGHAYITMAGLRFDTSSGGDGNNQGDGPRWRETKAPKKGYEIRHPRGL